MGVGTFSIGLLPVYSQVGALAAVALLLLRLLQGFAAGGEWGGAILMTTENAPPEKRGLWGACSQAGIGLGFVLATGAFFLVQQLGHSEFMSWGWRVPFYASVLIFGLGIYIRRRIPESDEFERVTAVKGERIHPLRDILRNNPRQIIVGAALRLAEMGGSHMMTAFALAYGTMVHAPASVLLAAVMSSMIIDVVMMIFFGWASDRVGRKPIYMFGILGLAGISYPFFVALNSGDATKIFAVLLLGNGVFHAAMIGVQPVMLTELFPVRLRSSGLAFAQAIAAIIAGFLPMAAAALFAVYRSPVPLSALIFLLCAVSGAALMFTYKHAES
jgi:MFS family permease